MLRGEGFLKPLIVETVLSYVLVLQAAWCKA
jgi:hypothetical protein